MSFGISLHVWGDYACFTRPELKAERMSYEVMTPSAARGILSAIYWKPEFNWVIDRIHVLKPIRFMQVRRNEVGKKFTTPSQDVMDGKKEDILGMFIEDERQQRASTILKDVSYIIEAHVEIVKKCDGVNDVAKHLEMFKRRSRQGQVFHSPYFGTREFPVMFELIESGMPYPNSELFEHQKNMSLGLMFHDMVYRDDKKGPIICGHTRKKQVAEPHFFMAKLENGVMSIPALNQTLC